MVERPANDGSSAIRWQWRLVGWFVGWLVGWLVGWFGGRSGGGVGRWRRCRETTALNESAIAPKIDQPSLYLFTCFAVRKKSRYSGEGGPRFLPLPLHPRPAPVAVVVVVVLVCLSRPLSIARSIALSVARSESPSQAWQRCVNWQFLPIDTH
jgi:hypothetical protein